MKIRGEWKFFLTLIITVASVVVPVWLWQADLSSKSLSIKMVTLVQLQPKEHEAIPGMEISVDGLRLERPHLVVFEIENDGKRPILATDFESPLDIRLESKTTFVRSRVSKRSPMDIEASINSEQKRISLKPVLLNPKDVIEITAITSGDNPLFTSKARVVGISKVSLDDSTKERPTRTMLTLLFCSSIVCLVALCLMIDAMTESNGIFIRRRAAAVVALASGIPATLTFSAFLEKVEVKGFWYFMLYYMIMMVPAGIIASALNRKEQSLEQTPTSRK